MTDTGIVTGYGYGHNSSPGFEHLVLSNQMSAGHAHLNDNVHVSSVNGIRETSQAARDTVDAVRDSIDASNQIGNINLQSTERNGGETRSSVERTAGQTRDSVNFVANQTARDFAGISRDICDGRREVSEGFGNTNLEMAKQHCDIKLELTKQHSDLARQADVNAAAAAKALADCCCELKQGQAETRALILSTDSKRVEQENANLRQELLLAKINGGPGNS